MREIIRAGVSLIKDNLGTVIDRVVTDPNAKRELQVKLAEIAAEAEETVSAAAKAELEAKSKLIIQELNQGDNFTKRMRPSIGYSGLVILFIQAVVIPILEAVFGVEITLEVPGAFWAAWSGVTGLYVLGRSAEKRGGSNLLTQLLTGNKDVSSLLGDS